MTIELIVMYAIQARKYRQIVDNLLVLLIGGIPIAMPTVLSVTMAIGSHKLAQQVWSMFSGGKLARQLCSLKWPFLSFGCLQGAITKRMTAIEEMAGMDVLCSDKTGTLTLNKLSVDKNLIEVLLPESFTTYIWNGYSCSLSLMVICQGEKKARIYN